MFVSVWHGYWLHKFLCLHILRSIFIMGRDIILFIVAFFSLYVGPTTFNNNNIDKNILISKNLGVSIQVVDK